MVPQYLSSGADLRRPPHNVVGELRVQGSAQAKAVLASLTSCSATHEGRSQLACVPVTCGMLRTYIRERVQVKSVRKLRRVQRAAAQQLVQVVTPCWRHPGLLALLSRRKTRYAERPHERVALAATIL
jgi:hypothetical protein